MEAANLWSGTARVTNRVLNTFRSAASTNFQISNAVGNRIHEKMYFLKSLICSLIENMKSFMPLNM